MAKKLYWYVVYWRNKRFLRTTWKPRKSGEVFGSYTPAQRYGGCWCRVGLLKSKGDFKIIEKYAKLGYMTKNEFKKWILDDST